MIHIPTTQGYLRPLTIHDLRAFHAYRSLPEVYKYQSFKPQNLQHTRSFILRQPLQFNTIDTWFQLLIINYQEQIVGDIGVHFLTHQSVEIGVSIHPRYQKQQYAYTSLMSLCNYLFKAYQKQQIVAYVEPNNLASIHLIKRLGMVEIASDDCLYLKYYMNHPNNDNIS